MACSTGSSARSSGSSAYGARLREARQHVKRGLLLHGPPGNGKTLLVRYVAAVARRHTVVILTDTGLGMVQAASSLARMLQPAVVVIEDVDLIAEMRDHYGGGGPLLFQLLHEMDGVLEDADVVFLLTTTAQTCSSPRWRLDPAGSTSPSRSTDPAPSSGGGSSRCTRGARRCASMTWGRSSPAPTVSRRLSSRS